MVGVVSGRSPSSSSEEACSSRSSRSGPIRVLRVCIASVVSLPLVSVGEVSEWGAHLSICWTPGCWLTVAKVLLIIVEGWSVRWRIVWSLHTLNACWPCTVWPVSGSMMVSFVEVCVRGNGSGSLVVR